MNDDFINNKIEQVELSQLRYLLFFQHWDFGFFTNKQSGFEQHKLGFDEQTLRFHQQKRNIKIELILAG